MSPLQLWRGKWMTYSTPHTEDCQLPPTAPCFGKPWQSIWKSVLTKAILKLNLRPAAQWYINNTCGIMKTTAPIRDQYFRYQLFIIFKTFTEALPCGRLPNGQRGKASGASNKKRVGSHNSNIQECQRIWGNRNATRFIFYGNSTV